MSDDNVYATAEVDGVLTLTSSFSVSFPLDVLAGVSPAAAAETLTDLIKERVNLDLDTDGKAQLAAYMESRNV